MNQTEVDDVVNHAIARHNKRFNEVLGLLASDSRLIASETPAGDQFQVIVRRFYQDFVERLSPVHRKDLQYQLQKELSRNLIVVDSMDTTTVNSSKRMAFRMHRLVPKPAHH